MEMGMGGREDTNVTNLRSLPSYNLCMHAPGALPWILISLAALLASNPVAISPTEVCMVAKDLAGADFFGR